MKKPSFIAPLLFCFILINGVQAQQQAKEKPQARESMWPLIECGIQHTLYPLGNNGSRFFDIASEYKSKELFGDKFNYSKVKYINGQTHVILICPENHEFEVTPNNHLSKKSGCPTCNESKLEQELASILDKQNIVYERQKRFKWLGRQSLDFYLPDYNIAIECQGIQHFKPVDFGGKGEKSANELFEKNKERDGKKLNKCLSNNIEMIWVVDNEEYLKNEWHFDKVEPFSVNVSYKIIHLNNFSKIINDLKFRNF